MATAACQVIMTVALNVNCQSRGQTSGTLLVPVLAGPGWLVCWGGGGGGGLSSAPPHFMSIMSTGSTITSSANLSNGIKGPSFN